MKRLITTSIILCLGLPLSIQGKPIGDNYFNKRLGRTLTRVHELKAGGFKALSKPKNPRREVFIDWRKFYWGKLIDLTCEDNVEEDTNSYLSNISYGEQSQDQESHFLQDDDSEALSEFVKEMRNELKAFAKHHKVKIIWRKTSRNLPDVTAEFIDFWDKGLSSVEQHNSTKKEPGV